jgi:hypothetical protein
VDKDRNDYADVVARRGTEVLIAEVKGKTTSPGLDVDTAAYGQLLRRMTDRSSGTRYALVLPTAIKNAATRVPDDVRRVLRIDIWTVDESGAVELT